MMSRSVLAIQMMRRPALALRKARTRGVAARSLFPWRILVAQVAGMSSKIGTDFLIVNNRGFVQIIGQVEAYP